MWVAIRGVSCREGTNRDGGDLLVEIPRHKEILVADG